MSEYDRYCPFYKTNGMLRNMIAYYDAAQNATENGGVWSKIRDQTSEEWYSLSRMKFEDPADGQKAMEDKYKALYDQISEKFRNLAE